MTSRRRRILVGTTLAGALFGGAIAPVAAGAQPMRKTPTTPSITNLPATAIVDGSFTATISTTSDGAKSITSTTTAVCSVIGFKVTYLTSGTCSLTASVAASSHYKVANGAAQSFVIAGKTPTTPSITNLPATAIVDGSFTATISTNSDGLASASSSTPLVCTVEGLVVSFLAEGTCTVRASVAASTHFITGLGSSQSFTVKPKPPMGWSRASSLDSTYGHPNALACPAANLCIALDSYGNAHTFNGSTWAAPVNIDGSLPLESLSCPSVGFCMATDDIGGVLTFDGTSWTRRANVASTTPAQVSCSSSTFCLASYGTGMWPKVQHYIQIFNGSSWSSPKKNNFNTFSCVSSIFCAADTFFAYDAGTFNGSTWTIQSGLDPIGGGGFDGISCATVTFCVAVDIGGLAFVYNGSTWSDQTQVYSHFNEPCGPVKISCPASNFCIEADWWGNVFTFEGTTWSAPKNLYSTSTDGVDHSPWLLSCSASSFCVDIDFEGNVFVGTSS